MLYLNLAISLLSKINLACAKIGRSIAWVLVAAMVATILLQVFMRYVLDNALPWPEEVARAFMIWMMALVAGEAYRQGSFVAIDLLQHSLPNRISAILKLLLLIIATLVLYQLLTIGIEFFQRGFRTRAASFQLSRAWIYLAMPVCFGTMLLVNIELILEEVKGLFSSDSNSESTGENN